jgi:hypothetical protein
LLATLDAAPHATPNAPLGAAGAAHRARGIAAACRLDDPLTRHRLRHRATWQALVRLPTIQRPRAGRAWRSEVERPRLEALARDLADGVAPDWREARWPREL